MRHVKSMAYMVLIFIWMVVSGSISIYTAYQLHTENEIVLAFTVCFLMLGILLPLVIGLVVEHKCRKYWQEAFEILCELSGHDKKTFD